MKSLLAISQDPLSGKILEKESNTQDSGTLYIRKESFMRERKTYKNEMRRKIWREILNEEAIALLNNSSIWRPLSTMGRDAESLRRAPGEHFAVCVHEDPA